VLRINISVDETFGSKNIIVFTVNIKA